jgi:hypothetical protein
MTNILKDIAFGIAVVMACGVAYFLIQAIKFGY